SLREIPLGGLCANLCDLRVKETRPNCFHTNRRSDTEHPAPVRHSPAPRSPVSDESSPEPETVFTGLARFPTWTARTTGHREGQSRGLSFLRTGRWLASRGSAI